MPAQRCTIHKDRETYRICGRCERPFCPDCLIETPVGGRCRECAQPARSVRRPVAWWRWPLIALAAVAGGLVGGFVAQMVPFFGWLLSYGAGLIVANAALNISGRRPGQALAAVTVVCLLVGFFLGPPVEGALKALAAPHGVGSLGVVVRAYAVASLFSVWNWVSAALMVLGAVTRLRQAL